MKQIQIQDRWDIVPVPLILIGLAVAGACAGVGLYVPVWNAVGVVIYGSVAIGLLLYGLFGCLAAPFDEGLGHGLAYLFLSPLYPIYFHATHPGTGWRPLINMVLGFGLIWVAVQTFAMFREDEAKPARPRLVGGDPLETVGPSRSEPDAPAAGRLAATTSDLAKLLASVTDQPSARKAASRYRQLMTQRRTDFEAAGESRALDHQGKLVSMSALITLGPRFRDANREYETQWKRVRRIRGLASILDGTH